MLPPIIETLNGGAGDPQHTPLIKYIAWEAVQKLLAQHVKTIPTTPVVGSIILRHANTNCEILHGKLELTHPYRRSIFVPIQLPSNVQKYPRNEQTMFWGLTSTHTVDLVCGVYRYSKVLRIVTRDMCTRSE